MDLSGDDCRDLLVTVSQARREAALAEERNPGDKSVVKRRQQPTGGYAFASDPLQLSPGNGVSDPFLHELGNQGAHLSPRLRVHVLPRRADEDVLEKLARAPSGPAVDMASESLLEGHSRSLEDLGVQVLRVIHNDDDGCPRRELPVRVSEDGDHVFDIGADGVARLTARGRTDLFLTAINESQEFVGVAVLLVIVDQPRIGRRRDDPAGLEREIDDASVFVEDDRL
jgi:hypothetical protein